MNQTRYSFILNSFFFFSFFFFFLFFFFLSSFSSLFLCFWPLSFIFLLPHYFSLFGRTMEAQFFFLIFFFGSCLGETCLGLLSFLLFFLFLLFRFPSLQLFFFLHLVGRTGSSGQTIRNSFLVLFAFSWFLLAENSCRLSPLTETRRSYFPLLFSQFFPLLCNLLEEPQ